MGTNKYVGTKAEKNLWEPLRASPRCAISTLIAVYRTPGQGRRTGKAVSLWGW